MSTLATQARGSFGTELPWVALVKVTLAPVVCTVALLACVLAYAQPFTLLYQLLAFTVFLLCAQVFGPLPLTDGRSERALLAPGRTMITGWLFVVAVLLLLGYITKLSALFSRRVLLTWFAVTPFALHAAEAAARGALARFMRELGHPRLKVIVGANDTARELAAVIRGDPCRGVVLGYFDDRSAERLGDCQPGERLGGVGDAVAFVKRHGVHVVYVTLPTLRDPRLGAMLRGLRDTTASVYVVPAALPLALTHARVDVIGGIPAIAVCESPFFGVNGVLKRTADVVLATVALVLCAPLMALLALGVKLSSPGPVLFKQRRYGLDGSEITVYKFRSMRVHEDGGHVAQATRDDPRITRFGAFLRRTSLDELPQFINVLQGRMSIVGPRPHAVAHNELYRGLIEGYMLRHKVRPGITGWAQINGYRGETADAQLMKKRVEYDLEYLKHWSLPLDLWIVLRTALVVLKDPNAY